MTLRSGMALRLLLAGSCVAAAAWPQTRALLGVYYGNQGWKMDQVRAMEQWQGKRHAVLNLFTNWQSASKVMDNLFNLQLPVIWQNGNVPMITWEPFTAARTPADVEVRIANGQYDAYIDAWAGRLKVFLSGPDGAFGTGDDRRVYIRLAHEMNGDWYPWGAAMGGDRPADYVRMWQRVVGRFRAIGLFQSHVQWVWCASGEDIGGFTAEEYFPGDAYVDWVGIDAYNWGASQSWSSWRSPEQCFEDMLLRVRRLCTKPVALTEFASTSSTASGVSVALKSEWISAVMAWVLQRDIRMVCWFNEDKETDWAVFGGARGNEQYKAGRTTYRAYSAYRQAVAPDRFLSSNVANPRLLGDEEFAGEWPPMQ